MAYLKVCILCLNIGLFVTACAPQYSGKVSPKVVNGEIDLTGWDFAKDGPVKLDGDWLFAWEKFVEPASWVELQKQMIHTAQVPARFNSLNNPKEPGKTLPDLGYASYALQIKGLGSQAAGVVVTDSFSASQLYGLDSQGRLLAEPSNYGKVASTAGEELPKLWGSNLLQIKPLPGGYAEQPGMPVDKVVILHLSSLNFADGGIYQSIELADLQGMSQQLQNKDLFQVFMVGIFFIIGLYHLILYFQRRGDKPSVYFGLFCLVLGMRLLVMGVIQRAGYNNSLLAWELYTKLEYLSLPLVTLYCACFFYSLIPLNVFNNLVKIAFLLALPLVFLGLFTEPKLLSSYLGVFQLYMLSIVTTATILLTTQALKGNFLAQMLLASFGVVTFGVVNDILHANGIIFTAFFGPYTNITFVLLQAGIISYNNAKAYQQAEYLSEKLGEEVKLQTKKLNRVQFLSQQIQNTSDLSKMTKRFDNILRSEYAIQGFTFYVIDKAAGNLKAHSTYESNLSQADTQTLLENHLELHHPSSVHGAVVKKGRSFFVRRSKSSLGPRRNSPAEEYNRKILEMKSLFIIPLKMDNRVYATVTFSDTKYQAKQRIKDLTKKERVELELLSDYVSSALYQALQKEKVMEAQEAVSRAKNEAAVNQLAAHLAHEVNNPLNYIATGKTMQQDSFAKFYDKVLSVLEGDDEDTRQFKADLHQLQQKFNRGIVQTKEGQERIAKVVAEIRAITGVDGLTLQSFDIIAKIKEELQYSMNRNQLKLEKQSVKLAGLEEPVFLTTTPHILARSLRTIISNCIHFSRDKNGKLAGFSIETKVEDELFSVLIGCQPHNLKAEELENLFDLEKGRAYGTEQIGLGMIKELLHKVHCDLTLLVRDNMTDEIVFKVLVPMGEEKKLKKQGKMSA